MLHIKSLNEGLEVFKALGSEVRMKIVELLSERGEMNMNEIAAALELTNGALTAHIRKLEECGIIKTVTECTGHGNQKLCSMKVNQILLSAAKVEEMREIKVYETELRVGHFSDYSVSPPCGLASVYSQIGEENDARYFAHPDRLQAGMLWFSEGFVEYRIPNMLPQNQKISQLTFYFEISSDLVGETEENLADIMFYLNGQKLGSWITPGEYQGGGKGIYTPVWCSGREKQFGLLKMVVINKTGAYLDGLKISDIGLNKFQLDDQSELRFRFAAEDKSKYKGGIALYGSGFGNYNQGIRVRMHYVSDTK